MEALYRDYKDRGLVALSLLAENESNLAPSVADLSAWASKHDLTHPVLADPGFQINEAWWPDASYPVPHNKLLEADIRIAVDDVPLSDTAAIEAVLPN